MDGWRDKYMTDNIQMGHKQVNICELGVFGGRGERFICESVYFYSRTGSSQHHVSSHYVYSICIELSCSNLDQIIIIEHYSWYVKIQSHQIHPCGQAAQCLTTCGSIYINLLLKIICMYQLMQHVCVLVQFPCKKLLYTNHMSEAPTNCNDVL